VGIDHLGPFLPGADTVPPVVFVGKTAPGPAEVGDLDMPEGGHHIVSDPPGIGYGKGRLGIVPHPITAVDTPPQMFGKMSVYMAVDPRSPILGINRNSIHQILLGTRRRYAAVILYISPLWISGIYMSRKIIFIKNNDI
jgi:hypothetical protein